MQHSHPSRRWTRRHALQAMAAAGLATGAAPLASLATGRPRSPSLGFAPNILFVLSDDGPRNSYGIDEGVFPVVSQGYMGSWLTYANASCNDPLCAPSRAATLSGLVSQHHHVLDNQTGFNLDLSAIWLVALELAGYLCGGYGKLINGYGEDFGSKTEVPPGFDDFHMLVSNPGYFDYVLNDNGQQTYHGYNDTNARGTDYLTDVSRFQILDFIEDCRLQHPSRPWAVYWAPNAPHRDGGITAEPPARYANADVPMTDPPNFNTGPQKQLPWLKKAQQVQPLDIPGIHYEHLMAMRALKAVNEGLGQIMDRLAAIGQLERTVIVVATDNSHIFGAYGLQDKGTSFEDSLNYLLRIRCPGVASGVRPQAVSNIDIAPFVCELAGAAMPQPVDGRSFAQSMFYPMTIFREAAPICHAKDGIGTPSFDGLRFANRKVVVGRAGGHAENQQWMHDLIADPWELKGLPPTESDLKKLQAMLGSF